MVMIAWRFEPRIPASDVLQGTAYFPIILGIEIELYAQVGSRQHMPVVEWSVPVERIQ